MIPMTQQQQADFEAYLLPYLAALPGCTVCGTPQPAIASGRIAEIDGVNVAVFKCGTCHFLWFFDWDAITA